MIRRIVGCAVAVLLLSGAGAFADTAQSYLGKTTLSSPTFNRPGQSSPFALSGVITHYHVQEFELPSSSTCYVYSAQSNDGYLHLYQGTFNPASPLTNLFAGDDDGDLGVGTSQLESLSLTAGHYALVTSSFGGGTSVGTFQNTIHCSTAQPQGAPCNGYYYTAIPQEDSICLNNRFLVGVDNISASATGLGHVVPVASKDTGLFWFYDSDNYEVMIKVLNGCGVNSHWWVFAGALTNQSYRLRVFDTHNPGGGINDYINVFPNQAPAITDINAFATCP